MPCNSSGSESLGPAKSPFHGIVGVERTWISRLAYEQESFTTLSKSPVFFHIQQGIGTGTDKEGWSFLVPPFGVVVFSFLSIVKYSSA